MSKKALLLHGGWGVAAIAAFLLGSLRHAPESDQTSAAPPSKGERFASRAAKAQGDRLTGSGGRSRSARSSGSATERSTPGGDDWETLARTAVRDSNPITRRLAFNRLLEALTPENARAIREQLLAVGANGEEWHDFNYQWGALAGREAFSFAAESEERDLDATLTGWASANPAEAIALLGNLPENLRDDRERLAGRVVEGLAHSDRSLATDLVLRLAADGSKGTENLIGVVTMETLRAEGPAAAAAWSETLPDGSLKATAMNRVADAFVRRDPEAATQWAERFAEQDYAAGAIEEVGDGLAARDPAAAATWLENLPEGRGQVAGLNSVFGDWEDRDPVAAGEYLMNMPQSAQRDSAISGFSRGYAWQDPQVAITWAQDIGDPTLRQETLTRAGQAFFRRDPHSARAWLETSGLPREAQEAVLAPPRRRQ